jgi:N-methylhydantoinase B
MYMPHAVESIPRKIVHGFGIVPQDVGISGGYPAPNYHTRIKRRTNIKEVIKTGAIDRLDQLSGETEDLLSISQTAQGATDVFEAIFSSGGGGYGDPLDRDPALVLDDVRRGLVSVECARKLYGVIIDGAIFEVDDRKTAEMRESTRKQRKTLGRIPVETTA